MHWDKKKCIKVILEKQTVLCDQLSYVLLISVGQAGRYNCNHCFQIKCANSPVLVGSYRPIQYISHGFTLVTLIKKTW